jgi:small subunit ribosomal protein S18
MNETSRPSRPGSRPPARGGSGADAKKRFRGKRFTPRRKVCRLCADHIDCVDYKQLQIVKTFIADSGKILSRRITGTCAKHQRQITRAIKTNRNLAILPYSS